MARRNPAKPDRNRSERSVRNRSAATAAVASREAATGRPAFVDDAELDRLAADLLARLGRPPRLDELIKAAGGCQRQRASKAVQRLREELARREVRAQLTLPEDAELRLREWLATALDLAAAQLARQHAALIEKHETARDADTAMLDEQKAVIATLRASVDDRDQMATEMARQIEALRADVAALGRERDIARALADDRRRMLEAFAQDTASKR